MMKRTIKHWIPRILLAVLMVQTSFVALADSVSPKVELTKGSNSISLTDLPSGIYATEITLYLSTGSLEDLDFKPEDEAYDSFIKVNDEESITLYVVSGTLMNDEEDRVTLGAFRNTNGIEFTGSSVKIVNFLQYPEEFTSVPVEYIEDTPFVPDGSDDDENVEEENEGDEEDDSDEENENTPEADEDSSSGGNFPSSSGGSSNNSGSNNKEEESLEPEVSDQVVDEETQQRYDEILQNFTDIGNHWAKENILYVMDNGYFKGISDSAFAPNESMTRAMFVTVMHSVDGGYFTTDISHFQDMKQEDWFYAYVSWGVANGITSGVSDTRFNPDGAVTREQMALMVYNYIQSKGYILEQNQASTPFADGDSISVWAVDAVDYIRQCGIISGKTGNIFDPQGIATRGEVATIIKNLVELIDTEKEEV